jgi:hypothetical protein
MARGWCGGKAWTLALTLACAPASACSTFVDLFLPSPPGTRLGSGSFLGFGKAFPDLNAQLTAGAMNREWTFKVGVQLSYAAGRSERCYVAPADMAVSVNGRPLALTDPGGLDPWSKHQCNPALFNSTGPAFDARADQAVVVIEHQGKRAEMRVTTYFQQRGFRVIQGASARPGDHVSLRWVPASDEWKSYDASTAVHLLRGGATIATVEKQHGITGDGGRMEFPVPRVAPGPAQLRVSLLHREPHPAVDSCLGLHRCDTTMPSELPKPTIPIQIQILE